ncbi:hypothetical protein O3M35_000507 [Rhynocoris fuscipes]|uniref:Glucose dehydrogenase [FAD, quinone]-like n=1 Tax=Rhynocoris fuscipes TaxID=488301 RepID=A0AAW1DSX2_9HEMI
MTSEVPRFYASLIKSDIDWDFTTRRERGLFNGLIKRKNRWPRGKVMGGTSTMGTMQYVRGDRRDYDNWAAEGNIGWSWYDVLPYFKKSEDMRNILVINQFTSYIHHGEGGPLTLSRFTYEPSFTQLILDAAKELNYLKNIDYNGIHMTGFSSPNYGTIRGGERLNTARAFLSPVKSRKNLFVIKHAFVSRVLICPSTKRAYGVEYFYKNEKVPRTVKASREVILSAGTVGSTKILLLSGVGPKAEVEDKGIVSIQNLAVGRNLIDHVQFPGLPVTVDIDVDDKRTPLDILDQTYEYLTRRTGPLAAIGLWAIRGYISIDDDEHPDILLHFLRGKAGRINRTNDILQFYKNIGIEEDLFLQIKEMNYDKNMILPIPTILTPGSRGSIKLKSRNPHDMPLINSSYLSEPCDLEYMLLGIRFVKRFLETNAMAKVNATLRFIQYPGCCNIPDDTEEYWVCALSHIAGTAHNQIGTNKMGPCSDPRAVVDPMLRVIGIKGLRVADSSIIPSPISGSTLAIAIMIGEKAADMIKEQWIPGFVPSHTVPPYPLYTQPWLQTTSKPFKPA